MGLFFLLAVDEGLTQLQITSYALFNAQNLISSNSFKFKLIMGVTSDFVLRLDITEDN